MRMDLSPFVFDMLPDVEVVTVSLLSTTGCLQIAFSVPAELDEDAELGGAFFDFAVDFACRIRRGSILVPGKMIAFDGRGDDEEVDQKEGICHLSKRDWSLQL